jgi:hypothetical protein
MRISVVNYSRVPDSSVQPVIRAVNRQIAEDFAPYWHRTAVLRLEGPPSGQPDGESTAYLRGDAIIYLVDEADDSNALGWHELNLRGVPYGFVFMDIAKEVGSPWSVTLSHEALELVMDPEANLLASGPHPEDRGRVVQHWYEVCDAVQDQTYRIDNVAVSNFVTPLYFTPNNEDGSRNEFLGASGRGRKKTQLPSFGVAPGGYVGYLDPETGEHETFAADGKAQRRLKARNRAGWARRGVRHAGEMSPDPVRRLVTGCVSGEPLPGPWFECFVVDVTAADNATAVQRLEAALTKVIGNDWQDRFTIIDRTPTERRSSPFEFDVARTKASRPVDKKDAFEWSYALAKQRHIALVEPSFVFLSPDLNALSEPGSPRRMSAAGERHLPQSENPYWCHDAMNLGDAWLLSKGNGINIGHPDTGFASHPEARTSAEGGTVRMDLGWDFKDNDNLAHPEFEEDNLLPGGPNHGTATASVIVSPANDPSNEKGFVVGAAPEAQLLPLRVANSVVHFSLSRVRQAIRYATERGCQVISMSLGGPFPSTHLKREIRRANENGVILVAAAGNHVPGRAVVFPARYKGVIAVAASNAADQPWEGSSRGDRVDITAPGESVWRALWARKEGQQKLEAKSERSSGTSYEPPMSPESVRCG